MLFTSHVPRKYKHCGISDFKKMSSGRFWRPVRGKFELKSVSLEGRTSSPHILRYVRVYYTVEHLEIVQFSSISYTGGRTNFIFVYNYI